jgi:hypothetical protein
VKIRGGASWKNNSQTVPLDLASLGNVQAHACDVWVAHDLGIINSTQNLTLAGHEPRLLILLNITTSPPPDQPATTSPQTHP